MNLQRQHHKVNEIEQQPVYSMKEWIVLNRPQIMTILILYLAVLVNIGLVNFPYIDDITRQMSGVPNFGAHYSRWGSEIFSWIFQGSRHLTDQGITLFILSSLILTLTSSLALSYVYKEKIPWGAAIISVLIGINPWFLECLSFRFDGPFMALSILFGFTAFYWWNKPKWQLFIASILSVFMLCNTYQSSSGVFIIVALTLAYKEILDGRKLVKVMHKLLISALGFILGMGIYLVETKFNPNLSNRGETVQIASIGKMPQAIIQNIQAYYETITTDSAKIWLLMLGILIVVFAWYSLMNTRLNYLFTLAFATSYLVVGAILSYGVLLVFAHPLVKTVGRYGGFGIWVFASLVGILSAQQLADKKISRYVIQSFLVVFMYYQLAFGFGYASMLSAQKSAFEFQSQNLVADLKNVVTPEQNVLHVDHLFASPTILENAKRNYPILDKIVPSISSMYWPNQFWFNHYTQIDVYLDTKPVDFNTFVQQNPTAQLVAQNHYYDMYLLNKEIYVRMKK